MDPASLVGDNDAQKTALGGSRGLETPRLKAILASLILLFAVGYNLVLLRPGVTDKVPLLNDGVLHRLALDRTGTALQGGQDASDAWLAPINLGYSFFHHYQNLPYLIPSLLTAGAADAVDLYDWTSYLLLSLFSLSIYWAMRRLGFSMLPAAWAGLAASLLSTNGLYGFDLSSYLWRGYGMYTQLWGMFLLPPALAQGYATLKGGRGYAWSVLLLAAVTLSHLVYGYIVFISLAALVILPALAQRSAPEKPHPAWVRVRRLGVVLVLVILVAGYFLLPYLLDRAYMNRSVWEEPGKYDAYGAGWTLSALVHGELFDFGRFPSLTILAGVGVLVCLWRWREERYRIPVVLLIVWLLLYFGRPTWGVLLNLLPLSQDLHFHRLIAGVHLAGILLIGIGLGVFWQWALSGKKAWLVTVAAVLTTALLVPVYQERGNYLRENASWMAQTQAAIAAEKEDLDALVDTLRQLPPGRVYAGLGANWGANYKVGDVPVFALLQSEGFDMLGYLYHALSLNADIQVLFDELRQEQYNLFNVRYVVAPAGQAFPNFVQPVAAYGRFHLYQVETTGYFDLVGSDSAFVGDKLDFYPAASRWLTSDLPRLKQHPALFLAGEANGYEFVYPLSKAEEVILLASFPAEASRGQVFGEVVGDNLYAVQLGVERESYIMLKATYDPNWHASVDGVEAETVMLMPSYAAVRVEPGIHQVLFEYRPQPWRGVLGIAGLLVLIITALAGHRQEGWWRWLGRLPVVDLQSHISNTFSKIAAWNPYRSRMEAAAVHLPYIGVLFLLTLLAGLPLFQFKIMSGHDAMEYLPRVVEFFQELKAGHLFPQWAPDFSGGYGQPFFIFNPPLFYYLASLFHALGFGFIASENLACFLLLWLAALGMYGLAGGFFGKRGGLVAAAAYLFTPYMLVNLYVRHALADFTALALLPWAFWGLWRFIRGRGYIIRILGPLSITLLLLSSNSVSLIAFPFLLLFAAWQAWTDRSLKTLLRGLVCLVLGLGLSAYFWLPALVERDFVHVERLLEGYLNYTNHFVYPVQLISSPWGFGLSLPGTQDGMSFAIGTFHLFVALAAVLITWRLRSLNRQARLVGLFSLVTLLLAVFIASTASKFIWDRLPLLQYLEFPWRFLTLVAFSTALLAGLPLALLSDKPRLGTGLAILLITGLFLSSYQHARPGSFIQIDETDYTPQAIASRSISITTAEEYEPIWVQERPSTPSPGLLAALSGEVHWNILERSSNRVDLQVYTTSDTLLQANIHYFPGWSVWVDGARRSIDYQNPQGLIQFNLEPGEHRVGMRFNNTPVRNLGAGLSILALVLLILPFKRGKPPAVEA